MLLYLDLAYADWNQKWPDAEFDRLARRHLSRRGPACAPQSHDRGVIIAGLLPIMWSNGSGADVMKRIATPMIGGVVTSVIMELVVFPAVYYLWRSRSLASATGENRSRLETR